LERINKFNESLKQNFTKTFPLEFLLYHADKSTDGRSGITKLVVDFGIWYANAPKYNTSERLFRRHYFKFGHTAYDRAQRTPLPPHYIGYMQKLYFPQLLVQNIDRLPQF